MTKRRWMRAPFVYFGGKRDAAALVWNALGDVEHYVEPFAGSLAVLLARPHETNRTYYSETVNDADGMIVNAWRSIQLAPDAVADAASWLISEADMAARQVALVRWRDSEGLGRLSADPAYCDPEMAGWWLYGLNLTIGSGWCGPGPWWPDADGVLRRTKGRPHLSDDGQWTNSAKLREQGIGLKLPRLTDGGNGTHAPQLREQGVSLRRQHLSNAGQGTHAPQLRGATGDRIMPGLLEWMRALSARLRHVRVACGDWSRVVTSGATKSLSVRNGGHCGIFLDPPYSHDVRAASLYSVESATVSSEARAWAIEAGADQALRIVFAGFAGEHGDEFKCAGWREVEWFRAGFLRGGYGVQGAGSNQARERLWLSPHCLGGRQAELFA